jgi:stringent starvation protein B
MTSSKPYLIRAIYQWLVDNQLTPYLMIDADFPDVLVPEHFIEDGQIVLNVAPQAIGNLHLGNEALEFDASFSGVITHLYIPTKSVMAIYAFENGKGMVFNEDDIDDDAGPSDPNRPPPSDGPVKGRPQLKIVK